MVSFRTTLNTAVVISMSNDGIDCWSSRLYVYNGETATLSAAKHQTKTGAQKWANKVLAAHYAV